MRAQGFADTWQLETMLLKLINAGLQHTCTYRALADIWQEQTGLVWSEYALKIYGHISQQEGLKG